MSEIIIYKTSDNKTEIDVQFDKDTVWINQQQMAKLFNQTKQNISLHINNCFKEKELDRASTVKESLTVQTEGTRRVTRRLDYYNLDLIISVGYRVKSIRGTQFRQWATKRLKDYLIQGYAINEKRLKQKQQEIEYLKTGIRILNRAIEEQIQGKDSDSLKLFAKGLELLDDYDHEQLDPKGKTVTPAVVYPSASDYFDIISEMKSSVSSDVFAKLKDESFYSSINQISQSFGKKDLYPALEEKAATLLYLIVKNHSFIDGNKRIGAACFLYFLKKNNLLFNTKSEVVISNEALATLTIFVASSKSNEMKIVKRLIISILNRR